MAGPMMGGMNPMLALLSPDQQQSYMQLQQQQALGQAMLQQGMQPVDMGQNPVGGMAYHVSPLNGINKVLQMYLGNRMAINAMGQQGQLMGQMYGNAFGQDQQVPVAQSAPPVTGADSGGLTGPTAGMGGMQGTPSPQALGATLQQNGVATPTQTVSTPGTFSMPGMTAAQSRQMYLMNPEEYAKTRFAYLQPTDATRMALAAGMDPAAANAGALFKNNFVAPVTGTGIFRDPRTMQPVAYNPEMTPGATPLFDASGNVAAEKPIQGAQDVMQGNAAATAAGGAQSKQVQVYNPVTKQMEYSNEYAVTHPGAPGSAAIPQIESQGNPNAVSPKGAIGAWQVMPNTNADPGFGVKPAQNNSPAEMNRVGQDYYNAMSQRYGDPAIAAVAYNMGPGATDKWIAGGGNFAKLPQETQLYLGRWTAANAMNNRAASQGGALAAAPPLGAVSNADTAQQASADSMKTSYAKLQAGNENANAALDSLQKMQTLAARKNPALTAGALGTMIAPTISPDAAEYEKQRANVISTLANQNGLNGSNEGRALQGESVPDYGKPNAAIQDGLQTQINQIRARQLKQNVLTPAYNAGDSKTFTDLGNQFDQNIKPSMMPILSQSGDAQRAAVQAAIKANPALRPNFEWAFNNGLLK